MELAKKDREARVMAAENALQKAQMEQMRAMLLANGLSMSTFGQGTSAQAMANSYPCSQPNTTSRPQFDTPNRKRHSSQQLGREAKDARVQTRTTPIQTSQDHSRPHPGSNREPVQSATSKVQAKGTFTVTNDKAMRQEIEIALESMNGDTFRGSLTRTEVKHCIYRECLGFEDFDNFDGVRFGFNSVPIVKIKLVTAINVDELYHMQHFNFRRKTSRQGKTHVDVIRCKIRGLRNPETSVGAQPETSLPQSSFDEGVRIIKIDGCDYKIPENVLIQFLSDFGEIQSEVLEDLFEDGICPASASGGLNRTGIYSVKIKLSRDIPQILPILGKRIKIHYKGIQKLCLNCFGPHPKRVCQSKKTEWKEYITKFMFENANIPRELYGTWFNKGQSGLDEEMEFECDYTKPQLEITLPRNDAHTATAEWIATTPVTAPAPTTTDVEAAASKPNVEYTPVNTNKTIPTYPDDLTNEPKKSDFLVPETRAQHERMIDRLIKGGSLLGEAEQIIASRSLAFNKACREHKKLAGKPSKWVEKSQKGQNRKKNQSKRATGNGDDYAN